MTGRNVFTTDLIHAGLNERELNEIKGFKLATIDSMITCMDVAKFRSLFTEPTTAPISFVRTALIKEKAQRAITKPADSGILSSSWQGKLGVDLVPIKDAFELIVKTPTKDLSTGTGPIVSLQELPKFMQRSVHLISCFTREEEERGVVSTVDLKSLSIFPTFDLNSMADIALALDKVARDAIMPKEDVSGPRWQSKLISIILKMSKQEQASLNNRILIFILQRARYDPKGTKDTNIVSWSSGSAQKELTESFLSVTPTLKIPLLAWAKNIPVMMNLVTAKNPHKADHPFSEQLGWAQASIAALGASNISALAACQGLSPGLSESESSIIRFITVAMAEFLKVANIKVSAPFSMLVLLSTSIKAYLINQDQTPTVASKLMKARVCFSHIGLKSTAIVALNAIFNDSPDCPNPASSSYIAWCPSKFSSAKTANEVVQKSAAVSTLHYKHSDGYKRVLLFREYLEEVSGHYCFLDGYPALFNYWVANVTDVGALEFKLGKYMIVALNAVSNPIEMAYRAIRQMLAYPMSPPTTRSHRILVVKGDKLLTAVNLQQVEDVMGQGNQEDSLNLEAAVLALSEENNPLAYMSIFDPAAQKIIDSAPPLNTSTTTTTTVETATTTTTTKVDLAQVVNADDMFS